MSQPMDRTLALEAVRVTEAAAIAAAAQIGRGDEHAADQAAVRSHARRLQRAAHRRHGGDRRRRTRRSADALSSARRSAPAAWRSTSRSIRWKAQPDGQGDGQCAGVMADGRTGLAAACARHLYGQDRDRPRLSRRRHRSRCRARATTSTPRQSQGRRPARDHGLRARPSAPCGRSSKACARPARRCG